MKFEKMNSNDYKIMFPFSLSSEEEIISFVKRIMKKCYKKFSLSGFYQITICSRSFGLFLFLHKEKNSFYQETFDYRVIFDDCSSFYYRTEDYFIIKDCSYVYYLKGAFYALVDDSFDKIFEKVEFGEFLFEFEFDKEESVIVNK